MSQPQSSGGGGGRHRPDDLEAQRKALIAAAISPDLRPFVDAMTAQGIPAGSQLDALRLVGGVKEGSAMNGYGMARLQGMSRDAARQRPATALLLEIAEFLGPDAPEQLQASVARRAPESFRIELGDCAV